jgi:hypothetical protein
MREKTRRQVLGAISVAAGACVFSSCMDNGQPGAVNGGGKSQLQWNYIQLDPAATAQRAYTDFSRGHCMYAVFSSVVGQLADIHGEPYSSFPLDMMGYGAGGVGGWGSLCGALNGSAAVIGLFVKSKAHRTALTNEVLLWHEQASLPAYIPAKADLDIEIPTSTADSVLCHVSVSKWCKVSGHKSFSKACDERCKRLSADVAAKTVQLLNAWHLQALATLHRPTKQLQTCTSCHGRGGTLENTRGKMNCTTCHSKLSDQHP